MQLFKFSIIITTTLIGSLCFSETTIKVSKPDGFSELGDAVMQILITCYPEKDKTIVFVGDFPGDFMEKLSSHQSFSVVSLHDIKRAQNNIFYWHQVNPMKYKTHIVVITVSFVERFGTLLTRYFLTVYENPMASVIIIGWSPYKKYGSCKSVMDSAVILLGAFTNNMLNANLICRERTKGITMYTVNPYVNHAPEPWQFFDGIIDMHRRESYFFSRVYREGKRMCRNLDFDKTQNLAGMPIPVVLTYEGPIDHPQGLKPKESRIRRNRIQNAKRFTFIDYFIAYVNATRIYLWRRASVGSLFIHDDYSIMAPPLMMRGGINTMLTYPHGTECKFLVTQFRGNKSQLEKIFGVIDNYSRYAMLVVYIITMMFFKYFLRHSVMAGILNICRLTCNIGIPKTSQDVSSRIYLGCLLFFVITMQGIFCGNLASLLTHDIPARQVNSLQDLVDLGYKVYAHKTDFVIFEDPAFKDLKILGWSSESCLKDVEKDPSTACLIWGSDIKTKALERGLHVSKDCVALEYICNILPKRWALQEKLNTFLSIAISTVTMMSLDARVDEMRLLEAESKEVIDKPVVMKLEDLGFAFAILAIGLSCASIIFVIELIIHRYQQRAMTTRVIVLR